jgi:hypothetical protein
MPRDYEIRVIGARHAARELGSIERSLRRHLFEAGEKARPILEASATALAPTPRDMWEARGAGIFTRVEIPHRALAGRLAGLPASQGFLIEFESTVSLGVEEGHVAAFAEAGTGTKRLAEFGGPREEYPIPNAFGRGGFVIHPGREPEPFLDEAAVAVIDEIEELYEHAVARATRGVTI